MSMQTLEARVQYLGGDNLGRINKQKLLSFKAALKNDYNKRSITTPNKGVWPCLINIDKIQPDYDKKVLSVEFNSTLKAGDVFEVIEDGTHWMVYLQDLVETAYLKTQIIRCRYAIDINGTDYWVYFKGPTEDSIDWKAKENLQYNTLNLSGILYVKSDECTQEFFKRFSTFKLMGSTWQCQSVDSISVPGILEVAIEEYFDDPIAELPSVIKDEGQTGDNIIGKKKVRQGDIVGYSIKESAMKEGYSWKLTGNNHVTIEEVVDNGRICKVKVHDGAIRTFTIAYGPYSILVNIDITESVIHGPQEVYPYDVVEYTVVYPETYTEEGEPVIPVVGQCTFSVNNNNVKIVSTTKNSCVLEMATGKSGNFIITAKVDGNTYTLPVKIKSL